MSKIGICPECGHSSKDLQHRHPKTGAIVCGNCYQDAIDEIISEREQEARKKTGQKKTGVCPAYSQGSKELDYRLPQIKEERSEGSVMVAERPAEEQATATCLIGRPSKWTDDEIRAAIERIFKKHGKVTPGLIAGEFKGAYYALSRRVKRGEFKSLKEAIEKVRKTRLELEMEIEQQRNLIQWALESTDSDKVARWITRRAEQKYPGLIQNLKLLLESEAKSEIEWAFARISRTVRAKEIVVEFLKMAAAEDRNKLMSLFDRKPGLNSINPMILSFI